MKPYFQDKIVDSRSEADICSSGKDDKFKSNFEIKTESFEQEKKKFQLDISEEQREKFNSFQNSFFEYHQLLTGEEMPHFGHDFLLPHEISSEKQKSFEDRLRLTSLDANRKPYFFKPTSGIHRLETTLFDQLVHLSEPRARFEIDFIRESLTLFQDHFDIKRLDAFDDFNTLLEYLLHISTPHKEADMFLNKKDWIRSPDIIYIDDILEKIQHAYLHDFPSDIFKSIWVQRLRLSISIASKEFKEMGTDSLDAIPHQEEQLILAQRELYTIAQKFTKIPENMDPNEVSVNSLTIMRNNITDKEKKDILSGFFETEEDCSFYIQHILPSHINNNSSKDETVGTNPYFSSLCFHKFLSCFENHFDMTDFPSFQTFQCLQKHTVSLSFHLLSFLPINTLEITLKELKNLQTLLKKIAYSYNLSYETEEQHSSELFNNIWNQFCVIIDYIVLHLEQSLKSINGIVPSYRNRVSSIIG